MLVEFSFAKQRKTNLGWEEIMDFSTTSIQTICNSYAKLRKDECLVIKYLGEYLGKDRRVCLVLNKEELTILIGDDFQGKRKTKEIENVLYDFLEALIYNKSFCGIDAKEILFDWDVKAF